MILVTGGAGFIGSNFVLDWLARSDEPVVNLDALTYAGNTENLKSLDGDPRHVFVRGDICDRALVERLLATHRPRAIVHFAAESHVDRSIHGPAEFIRTNVEGTFTLLEAARGHWSGLPAEREGGVPLPARLDRRGLRQPRPRRPGVSRDRHLRAEQPVLGEQGGERPPRARLAPHLPAAGADDQLQQQLRPVPLPGKADPADDRQRPRRQAAAGVRRRPAGARLAVRQRPLQRGPRGARARPRRRDLQRRRLEREAEPGDRPHGVRPAGRTAAAPRRPLRTRSSRTSPTGPATTAATRSTRARSSASSAGGRPRPSSRACARPCAGTSTTPRGSSACRTAPTANG